MSQHRGRNIFTLGDFHLKKQRSSSESRKRLPDPFERDPFKIQSYNFRYADRPAYPVRPTQRQQEPQAQNKQFNTFYYNQDFSPEAQNPRASRGNIFGNNECGSTSSKYQAQRRRKFVQNSANAIAQQSHHLGRLSSYTNTTSLNSSTNFQFQNNRQPVSNSSFLRPSYADNILEHKKSQRSAASTSERYCERNNGSSALTCSLANSLKAYGSSNRQYRPSLDDMCNRTASSIGNANGSGGILAASLIGNANSSSMQLSSNANPNSSVGSMRPNISHATFIESPQRYNQSATSTVGYSNSRIAADNTQFKPTPTMIPFSLPSDTRTHQSTSRSPCSKRKRSSSSGCEININIKNLENNAITENLTIKIERDPLEQNLDVTPAKKLTLTNNLSPHSPTPNIKFNINGNSSTSFVIDKRLSKFSMAKPGIVNTSANTTLNTKRLSMSSLKSDNFSRSSINCHNNSQASYNNPLEKNLRERTKTLSSIYAPQLPTMATERSNLPYIKPSTERLPSLVPWRDNLKVTRKSTSENLNSPRTSKDVRRKSNLPPDSITNSCNRNSRSSKISDISQTTTKSNVNNFMKSKNCKISLKRIILQKFHSSKYARLRGQSLQQDNGALPTIRVKRCLSKYPNKLYCCSRTKKINWSKLPFKININVFAEKVKLLRA